MSKWLLLLCLASTPVSAGNVWGHFASKHWNGNEYNEANIGLAIEFTRDDPWSLELGIYKNSYSRPTKYVWGGYSFSDGPLRVRALAGFADRYSDTELEDGTAIPVVGVSFEYRRARATLLPGALGFSWKLMEF